jgi:glycosyltransferase involved in cell wall biosynthesis
MVKKIEEFVTSVKELTSKIDLFIAPTHFIRDKFIGSGFPGNKILYSGYGFNIAGFRSISKKKSNLLRFAYLGTLLPMKGLDVLISAFKEIKNEQIELSIYGKIFAYSDFEFYPEKLKRSISMDKRIKLMGGYNNNELADILANIDVVVVPSLWLENSPLVIQEAFMAKIPVIASRIGGIPESIDDGVNGLLFNPGDINDLREKLEYIINNPGVIQKFKDNLPKIKNIEENASEMEEIYGRLASGGKV